MKRKIRQLYTRTVTKAPSGTFIAHLSILDGALAVRYFRQSMRQDIEPVTNIGSADPGETPYMRVILPRDTGMLVMGETLSDNPIVAGKRYMEFARQYFRPMCDCEYVGAAESADFALWSLPMTLQGEVADPYNVFAEGQGFKAPARRIGQMRSRQGIFHLASLKADAPIEDWMVTFHDSMGAVVLVDTTPGAWEDGPGEQFTARDLLPTMTLTGPSTIPADGVATLVAKVIDADGEIVPYDGEIYVEPVSGYVPHTRALLESGQASFKVAAMWLQPGEQMRVKVGTRLVSGLADHTLTVS